MYLVYEVKYPEDPNNRSYQVSRQRWISHYVRRIQQVLNNVVAPAISLTFRNLVSTSNTQVLMAHDHLEPPSSQVPEFRNGGEAHDDQDAYESMDGDRHFQVTSESIFNDQEYTDSPPDKDKDGAYLRCSIPNSANKSSSFFCFASVDFSVFSNIERIFSSTFIPLKIEDS